MKFLITRQTTTLAAPAALVPEADKIAPEKVKPAPPCQSASGTDSVENIQYSSAQVPEQKDASNLSSLVPDRFTDTKK